MCHINVSFEMFFRCHTKNKDWRGRWPTNLSFVMTVTKILKDLLCGTWLIYSFWCLTSWWSKNLFHSFLVKNARLQGLYHFWNRPSVENIENCYWCDGLKTHFPRCKPCLFQWILSCYDNNLLDITVFANPKNWVGEHFCFHYQWNKHG